MTTNISSLPRLGRRPSRNAIVLTIAVWLPMLGWFAAFRPGFMSADSLEIYRQATQGGWLDIQPPIYTAAMWLSHVLIGSPSLLTLAQSLFLAAGIAAVAVALVRIGANRTVVLATTAVVALSPQVGAFSISMWKDVPYAATFLLVSARVIDLARARMLNDPRLTRRVIWSLALWFSVAAAFRQNGILLAVGLAVALALIVRSSWKQILAAGLIAIAVLGLLKVVVYRVIGVKASGAQPSLAIQLHDIAAGAQADPDSFTASDRALMDRMAPFEVWRQTYASSGCSSANWEWDPRFRWDKLDGHSSEVISLWTRVIANHPLLVARNRLCIGAIAFRPDTNAGVLYTVSRGVDANPLGLHTAPIIGALDDPGRNVLDVLDEPGIQGIAWRAPGWIYAAYVAVLVVALRRRRWELLLPALPLLMLQLSVFPVNPAQDARYMFPGLVLAVLLLTLVSVRSLPPGSAAADVSSDRVDVARSSAGGERDNELIMT